MLGRHHSSRGIAKFFTFVLDCVYHSIDESVVSIGSQACLAAFISENSLDNPYPIEGDCRVTYQILVDGLYDGIHARINDNTARLYCARPNVVLNNSSFSNCLAVVNSAISTFYGSTGFYPATFCKGSQVRAFAQQQIFTAAIVYNWEFNASLWLSIVSPVPHDSCDYCVNKFSKYLSDFLPPDGNIMDYFRAECGGLDGPTDACLATDLITNARLGFLDCAGWDILFEGPVCTVENVNTVQALIPAPYYAFSQCAYHPATPFCSTISAYLGEIESQTNSLDCVACYTELSSNLQKLSVADSDDVCKSDVYSTDCLIYHADALKAFATCAGTSLNTDVVIPLVTIIPPSIDVTTTVSTTSTSTSTKGVTETGLIVVAFYIALLVFN